VKGAAELDDFLTAGEVCRPCGTSLTRYDAASQKNGNTRA